MGKTKVRLVRWNGGLIVKKTESATARAIDEATAEAAALASASHWWKNRSGNLQSEIVTEKAALNGQGQIVGRFGTTKMKGFYGLFLERKHSFLRPAADTVFHALGARIRSKRKHV